MESDSTTPIGGNRGWLGESVDYLKRQKPETVLLFLIFGLLVFITVKGVPWVWDRNDAGQQKARDEFAIVNKEQRVDLLKQNEKQLDSFTRTLDRLSDQLGK